MSERKKLPAVFYCTANGREPVREWLKAMQKADRSIVGQTQQTPKADLDLSLKRKREVTS